MAGQTVVVSGFLVKDSKVLLIRRSPDEKFLPSYFELPGGKMEFGEKPADSLKREFKEETGLGIEVGKPYSVFSYVFGDRHQVEIVFMVRLVEDSQVKLGTDHDAYLWTSLNEISKHTTTEEVRKNVRAGFEQLSA